MEINWYIPSSSLAWGSEGCTWDERSCSRQMHKPKNNRSEIPSSCRLQIKLWGRDKRRHRRQWVWQISSYKIWYTFSTVHLKQQKAEQPFPGQKQEYHKSINEYIELLHPSYSSKRCIYIYMYTHIYIDTHFFCVCVYMKFLYKTNSLGQQFSISGP